MDCIWRIESGSFRAEIDVRKLHALPLNNARKLLKLSQQARDGSFEHFLVLLDRAIRGEHNTKNAERLKKIQTIYSAVCPKH